MANLTFEIKRNYLSWNGRSYRAISGPFKKGKLETGKYRVETRRVVSNISDQNGFYDQLAKSGWFIPITPLFKSQREGLGIHPDGNGKGTEGCLGLQGAAAGMFWKAWLAEPLNKRPAYLIVVDETNPSALS